LALWLLPAAAPRPRARLDTRGLVLASGGIAVLLYGLGRVATGGAGQSALGLAACVAGLAMLLSFGIHALRTRQPLIDVRLFARRGVTAGALSHLGVGVALFGGRGAPPLYFQSRPGRAPPA